MEVGESGGREWVEVGVKPPPTRIEAEDCIALATTKREKFPTRDFIRADSSQWNFPHGPSEGKRPRTPLASPSPSRYTCCHLTPKNERTKKSPPVGGD